MQVGDLFERSRRNRDGVAVALATAGTQALEPGRNFGLSAGLGFFDGSNGAGVGAVGRLFDTQGYSIFLNAGVGVGFDTGAVGGRTALNIQW